MLTAGRTEEETLRSGLEPSRGVQEVLPVKGGGDPAQLWPVPLQGTPGVLHLVTCLFLLFPQRTRERQQDHETVQMMTFTKSWHHWPEKVSGTHLPPEATVPPTTPATP